MDPTVMIAVLGVVMAAAFWIVTQWNVIRTKNILLKFSQKSKQDATDLINGQFARMETLIDDRIVAMEQRINGAMSRAMEQIDIPEIPKIDLQPIYDAISAQGVSLKADVIDSCSQAFRGMQSGAARALQGQLGQYDELLDNVGGEIMSELAQRATPLDLARAEILGTKVSDKYAKEHPAAAMLIKAGKIQMMQMLDAGQIPGIPAGINATQNIVPTTKTSPFS
jgi:hypothetical protein